MRFTQQFGLGLAHYQVDFIDIELTRDQPLFVDPYALQLALDPWARRATQTIRGYFQSLVDAIRAERLDDALEKLAPLREPRETRLGLSQTDFDGNAIGEELAGDLLTALRGSRAVRTGLLNDLAEAELFVPLIGHDRVSDLATVLIRRELIEYTQEQCQLHGVPMQQVASGEIWNPDSEAWEAAIVDLPVASGVRVLLVPKRIARWSTLLRPHDYYSNYIVEHIRQREYRQPTLGLGRLLKNGSLRISKKEVKAEFPFSKDFLAQFSREHPDVLEAFKAAKAAAASMDVRGDLDENVERAFASALVAELLAIPQGGEDAHLYHRFMKGVLEFLFFPALSHPRMEQEINEGRKRIDILLTNVDRRGFFFHFPNVTRLSAIDIVVECKNYTREIGNPEIDQIAMRFADHRGWLGLLVCRRMADRNAVLARCLDVARDGHGYILPLDDEDIVSMLGCIENGDRARVQDHLERIFQALRI